MIKKETFYPKELMLTWKREFFWMGKNNISWQPADSSQVQDADLVVADRPVAQDICTDRDQVRAHHRKRPRVPQEGDRLCELSRLVSAITAWRPSQACLCERGGVATRRAAWSYDCASNRASEKDHHRSPRSHQEGKNAHCKNWNTIMGITFA